MQILNDINIKEYSQQKWTREELSQKNLLLSLSVFQDELEYAIIDLESNNVYSTALYSSASKKFTDNELMFLLNDFIHRYHLNQNLFKQIHIIFSSSHFTLCPTEFYVPEKKHLLLQFAHPVKPDEQILAGSFENIKVIYSTQQKLHNDLLQLFPSAKIFHSSIAMMDLFFYHPLLIHSSFWIHIHPNYIEVMAKQNRTLLFYNMFDIQTASDILYYVLFSLEQLKLLPKDTDVFISGNISLQHTIFQLLQKYVHSVQVLHHHPKLHILPVNSDLISHHHFITMNHYLCVSYQENTKAEN